MTKSINNKNKAFARILFEEAESPNSRLNEYLEKLWLKFILENLDRESREIFIEKLDYKRGKALAFAQTKIPDFEKKLNLYLQANLQKITREILGK